MAKRRKGDRNQKGPRIIRLFPDRTKLSVIAAHNRIISINKKDIKKVEQKILLEKRPAEKLKLQISLHEKKIDFHSSRIGRFEFILEHPEPVSSGIDMSSLPEAIKKDKQSIQDEWKAIAACQRRARLLPHKSD